MEEVSWGKRNAPNAIGRVCQAEEIKHQGKTMSSAFGNKIPETLEESCLSLVNDEIRTGANTQIDKVSISRMPVQKVTTPYDR
jgi:hypothetical protein